MTRRAQFLLVMGGYALAVVAAFAAGWLYDAWAAQQPYDTSGGMYAGGQMLTCLAVFLVVALVPTLMALWFLRSHPRLWQSIAGGSLIFAIVGLAAVLSPVVMTRDARTVPALMIDLIAIAHWLGSPLWLGGFVLFAILAPTRSSRRLMLAAIGVELVVGVCSAVHWLIPQSPI